MAKITRYQGDLEGFSSSAVGQERVVFGDTDATQSDDLTANINSDFLRGWGALPLGNKPPREWFNSVHWVSTQLSAYLHQMGVAEWHVGQEYHKGSVANINGTLYKSVADSNIGNDPLTDSGANWEPLVSSGVYSHLKILASAPKIPNNTNYAVASFYEGKTEGGGIFVYDDSKSKADHNGITVIDPDRLAAWDGTAADLATYYTTAASGAGCYVRVDNGEITAERAGAVGDGDGVGGGTDNKVALISLINFGGNVSLGERLIYRCDDGIQGTTHGTKLDFNGSKIDFSNVPEGASTDYISFVGTEGAEVSLTGDVVGGDVSIPVASGAEATFTPGEWLRLGSELLFDQFSTSQRVGELLQVDTVAPGVINLKSPVVGQVYNVSDSATVSPVSLLKDIKVKGGTISGVPHTGTDMGHIGLLFDKCYNACDEDMRYEDTNFCGVRYADCVEGRSIRPKPRRAKNAGNGYGISASDASQDLKIIAPEGIDTRHLFTTNNQSSRKGITRRVDVIRAKVVNTINGGDALDTHTAAENINFYYPVILSSQGQGINHECRSGEIVGGEIRDTGSNGINAHNESDLFGRIKVHGVRVIRANGDAVKVNNGVRGTAAVYNSISVTGIRESGCAGAVVNVQNTVDAARHRSAEVYDNESTGNLATLACFYVSDIDGLTYYGNIANEPTAATAHRIRDCLNYAIGPGNVAKLPINSSQTALYLNASGSGTMKNGVVNGFVASSPSAVASVGIKIDDGVESTHIAKDNRIAECTTPIEDTGGLDVWVEGRSTKQVIAAGEIYASSSLIFVDTESLAATDDLDNILGAEEGAVVTLSPLSSSRDVVVKDGASIKLNGSVDFTLSDTTKTLTLMRRGALWLETARGDN